MAESSERPSKQWNGVPETNQELLDLRGHLTSGAASADWVGFLAKLQSHPRLVNSVFLKRGSWSTLLHDAARQAAPAEVVSEILRLGAFRTVRDSDGHRPVDVVTKSGDQHLAALYEPQIEQVVDRNRIAHMQELFHGLIRSTMVSYSVRENLWLPQLSMLLESKVNSIWFPLPGMYGGFHFWLEGTDESTALIAESWSRVVGGSGMRHRITPVEVVLEEEGFV